MLFVVQIKLALTLSHLKGRTQYFFKITLFVFPFLMQNGRRYHWEAYRLNFIYI